MNFDKFDYQQIWSKKKETNKKRQQDNVQATSQQFVRIKWARTLDTMNKTCVISRKADLELSLASPLKMPIRQFWS